MGIYQTGGCHRIVFHINNVGYLPLLIVVVIHHLYMILFGLNGFKSKMSGICAFFGHRDTIITYALEEALEKNIKQLIEQGIDEFWCCDQGNFDWASRMVLLRLKKDYKHIHLCYICAYNPDKYSKTKLQDLDSKFEIIYPDEVSIGHPKFAITRRNKYIAQSADTIICYIERNIGGAYNAIKSAKQNEKTIINLIGHA